MIDNIYQSFKCMKEMITTRAWKDYNEQRPYRMSNNNQGGVTIRSINKVFKS